MERVWVFARHGQSVANAEGWLAGHEDVDLTPTGEVQAQELALSLAGRSFSRILCSDLRRAYRTAQAVCQGRDLLPQPVQALRERYLGQWAGRTRVSLLASGEMERLLGWWDHPPEGESHQDLALRALRWLAQDEAQAPGGATLLVGHGGLNRVLLGLLDERPLHEIGRHRIQNVEVYERMVPPGRWAALLRDSVGRTPPADGSSDE